MAQIAQLAAEPRAARRKAGAKALRNAAPTPAVIYGHGREPAGLSVDGVELSRLLEKIAPESTIVELTVDGATVRTLIREVQRHPLKPGILHVDFQEIHAGERIRLPRPAHLAPLPH